MNNRRILVIDDSSMIRRKLERILRGEGFEVVEASDGVEGLALIRGGESFGLVFCDMNMPNKDGMDLLRESKDERAEKGIPVVVISTDGRREQMMLAKELGVKAWLVKPFLKDQICMVAKRFLGESLQ